MTLRSLFLTGLLFPLLSASVPAGSADKRSQKTLEKIQAAAGYRPFLINAIFNYYGNNGDGSFNKFSTDNEGFEFFKGSGKHLIFEDGLVWGGFHRGGPTPVVGGSIYRHGIQPGPIIRPGTLTAVPLAADPADQKYRIYRVRPDIRPSIPFAQVQSKIQTGEVAYISRYENYSAQDIYNQYIADWNEWPADLGAPFSYGTDAAGILRSAPASYDPRFDIPGQPGADQTLWYVANDMDSTLTMFFSASRPIGTEIQRTIWGYHRNGVLDQTIFISTKLINKSGARIDSMFISQFSDPDLGDANDDFDGCDTLRDLGYVYNGVPVDAVYGSAVPAVGFTLLQGPIVPSPPDSAIFMQGRRPGYKNLRMSSFEGTFPIVDEPVQGDPWGTYRIMNGLLSTSGSPMIDPLTGSTTKFYAPGDPVTRTGWIDGLAGLTASDRRMYLSAGPFTMAAGDTQEIVVANCAGLGAERLSSISALRSMVDGLRSYYWNFYHLSPVNPAPLVNVASLDGEVILTWGDPASITAIETTADQGYAFEGYNVYEYASSAGSDPTLIATYDVVDGIKTIADTVYDQSTGLNLTSVVQRGTDSGIQRSVDLKRSVITNIQLSNGTPYYYAVTSYRFSGVPTALVGSHSIESSPRIVTAVPQSTNPGTRYNQARGDPIPVTLTTATGYPPSDGSVFASVADPTRITGDTYAVTFTADSSTGMNTWEIADKTTGRSLASRQTYQKNGIGFLIADGVQVEVLNPPGGVKTWSIPSGVRRWTSADADPSNIFHLEAHIFVCDLCPYGGVIGNAHDHWFSGGVPNDRLASVLIRFAATDSTWDPRRAPTDSNFSRGYRYLRNSTTDPMTLSPQRPEFIPWIVNKGSGFVYQDYNYGIPFSAWNFDVTPPRRLAVGHLENVASAGFVDGKYLPPLTGHGFDNTVSCEWFFVFDAPYSDPLPDPKFTVDIRNVHTPMMWFGLPMRRGNTVTPNDQFLITANHTNGPGNTFLISTIAPTIGDPAIARADVTRINVFPNPYQSFDRGDLTRFIRVVTFTHLPQRAIIRIYTLAGVMVKSMQKDDPGQFIEWDMKNESGRPVASGMYLVHIQMPDLGSTKTLKLGILGEKR